MCCVLALDHIIVHGNNHIEFIVKNNHCHCIFYLFLLPRCKHTVHELMGGFSPHHVCMIKHVLVIGGLDQSA